jgi:hypothetical protein
MVYRICLETFEEGKGFKGNNRKVGWIEIEIKISRRRHSESRFLEYAVFKAG